MERNGVVLVTENSMGICAESGHKEAAWRFLVECARGERAYVWSFSALEPQLEKQFVPAAERWMTVDYDGNDMEIPRSTYEYKGETISLYAASEEEIEAAYYFVGQKSAEEAAQIIVNRMNLYRNQEMQ